MHVVVFAGGTLHSGKAVTKALEQAELIIAADRGASTARQFGCVPTLIVGDFDSLSESVQSFVDQGSQLVRARVEKDETDTELALQEALKLGADRITLLGAIGGARIEHAVANILLLIDFTNVPLQIVDGPSICWLVTGPGSTSIQGQKGDYLSLFPLTVDAQGITSKNLYYPLHQESLRFGRPRGVSNVLTEDEAEVSLDQGILLVIHTAVQELHE